MKMRYVVVLALIAAVMVPAVAQAQETRFEVTPYASWRHGNDITDVSGIAINLESGVAYGFMVDVNVTSNLQIEFIYSYRRTGAELFIPNNLPEPGPVGTVPLEGNVDYTQGGVLYQFDLANPKIKPFIVGTLGVASMRSTDRDASNLQFSWSGGIGAKFMFSRNIGIRTEYRIFSTSTNFVGRGGWCDWWGFCYTFLTDKRLYQSQLAAGLIVAF
jgi:opacity protein-like surface antigen